MSGRVAIDMSAPFFCGVGSNFSIDLKNFGTNSATFLREKINGISSLVVSGVFGPRRMATRTGWHAPFGSVALQSFGDDFYHRVYITPKAVDLGNVVSTQTLPVYVWNAHLAPRTLASMSGLSEGVYLSGQPAPPLLYPPLIERTYQLSVTPDGAPVLDTLIGFNFGDETPGVRVTANRVIAWGWVPDWSRGMTERLSWRTDILRSESMAEQRRSLLLSPRREFEAPIIVAGRERQFLDMALFGWGSRVWALPIWPDIQIMSASIAAGAEAIPCATTGRSFRVGGLALLRAESAFETETVEVEAIFPAQLVLKRPTQRAWPAGTRLYPAVAAQLTGEIVLDRLSDDVQEFTAAWRVLDVEDAPAVPPTQMYRGWPVLADRPNERETLTSQFERLLAELDSGTAVPLVSDSGRRALPVSRWYWTGNGIAERSAFRGLLHYLAGRFRAIWVPTHADDLMLVATIAAAATTMDVAWVGYTRFGKAQAGRRDVRIELRDGAAVHLRITGATEISGSVERLALEAAPGITIHPVDVARISFIALFRGMEDAVEIMHHTDVEGVAECALVFQGVRDDDV